MALVFSVAKDLRRSCESRCRHNHPHVQVEVSFHLCEYRCPRVVIEARREAVLQRPSDPSERFARNHIARLSPQVPFDLELEVVVDTRQELLETCELFLFESCILVKSVEESPDEQMLARRVCCRRNLGPGGGWSP